MTDKLSILILDDEEEWRMKHSYKLQEKGFEPLCADTAECALKLVKKDKEFKIKAAIVDQILNVPGNPRNLQNLQGTDVLEKLKQRRPDILRVMVTSAPEKEKDASAGAVKMAELNIHANVTFPKAMIEKQYTSLLGYLDENIICKATSRLQPPYTIESSGDYLKPVILIKSKNGNKLITKEEDARLIFYLGDVQKKQNSSMSKAVVCLIYRKKRPGELQEPLLSKYAEIDITSFRRRLAKAGLNPDSLIKVIRKEGWKLAPDVILRGFASVDKRASMNTDDLPDNDHSESYNESDDYENE